MTQHYAMLQRNLLYTGVTRGKRLVVLVGQKKAVAIAVRNVSGRRRWSQLLTYRCGAANRASWRYLRQWFGAHNANRPIGYRPALRRQIGRHSIRTSNLAIGLVKGF
jgi:UvrD-like helicase C-terminal domain